MLSAALTTLEAVGLIRIAQAEPELEYLFRHALVQDATYASLLRQDRRVLHRQVGKVLETLYADRLNEFAPVLAQHFAEADEPLRALHYFELAAQHAARQYANGEAIGHYRRAITLAKAQPIAPKQLIDLYLRCGRVLELHAKYDAAFSLYVELMNLGKERQQPELELAGLIPQGTLRSTFTPLENRAQAHQLAEQALLLARQLNDRRAEGKINWNLMHSLSWEHPIEGLPYGERALALARELNLREDLAYILNDISQCYRATLQTERALEVLAEAEALWKEFGNLPMLADNYYRVGTIYRERGGLDQAEHWFHESLRACQQSNNTFGEIRSYGLLGRLHMARGFFDQALATYGEGIAIAVAAGLEHITITSQRVIARILLNYGAAGRRIGRPYVDHVIELLASTGYDQAEHCNLLGLQARYHIAEGDFVSARASLDAATAQIDPNSTPSFMIYRPMAEIELTMALGDHAAAITQIDAVLTTISKHDYSLIADELLVIKTQALIELNQWQAARIAATEALTLALAQHEVLTWWPSLLLLAQIETQQQNHEQAAQYRNEAARLLQIVLDHTSDPALRTGLLSDPVVQRGLGPMHPMLMGIVPIDTVS